MRNALKKSKRPRTGTGKWLGHLEGTVDLQGSCFLREERRPRSRAEASGNGQQCRWLTEDQKGSERPRILARGHGVKRQSHHAMGPVHVCGWEEKTQEGNGFRGTWARCVGDGGDRV